MSQRFSWPDFRGFPQFKDTVRAALYATACTGCPIDMLTTSDQILKIEKSHMPKSKPCFKILE